MNEENIERAWGEIDKGKIKDGINILIDVLRQSPNDWKVYYNLGQAYKIDGNIDKAIELLDKAKTLDNEGHLCNYFGLTEVYMMKSDFENAMVSLRNVFSSSEPKTVNVLQIIHSIGVDFFKNNQIHFAKEVFEKANGMLFSVFFTELRMSSDYPENYILRTVGNESELDWAKINKEFDKFLKTNPLCCQIKNNLGVCRAELGDLQGAMEAFNESIKFTPDGLDYQAPITALKEIEDMNKEESEIFKRLGYSENEIEESGKIIFTESGKKVIMNKRESLTGEPENKTTKPKMGNLTEWFMKKFNSINKKENK
jgi:tetratricopeptide (TPR) repeat protein